MADPHDPHEHDYDLEDLRPPVEHLTPEQIQREIYEEMRAEDMAEERAWHRGGWEDDDRDWHYPRDWPDER